MAESSYETPTTPGRKFLERTLLGVFWDWDRVNEVPNKGFIYYLHILNTPRVIVCSPNAVQQLCVRADDFTKPKLILMLAEKFLGLGLVLAEGQVHRRQRRTFLPIFAPRHVREMYPIFWAKTREVTQKLAQIVTSSFSDEEKGEGPVAVMEVGHWSSRAALDIVTMATLGKDFGSVANEDSRLARTYREALEPTRGHLVQAMFKLFLPPRLVEAMPNRWNRAIREYIPIFRGVCRDLLIEKRQQAADKSKETGKDLLSLCFQYEEVASASEEDLIDQLATFLAAGHETISVGITWAVYMLCLHPEWQTLLRDEARAHFPDPNSDNGEPDPLDVEVMPLTQAFIHEVLRWYPPIPETMREPLIDTVVDGQFLPKGMTLVVPIKGIMRHPDAFGPDANVFNPRRWLTDVPDADGKGTTTQTFNNTGGATSKYANLSFMQGIRSCIAMNFAKAEMACIISAWAGRFSFELEDSSLLDERNMRVSNGSFSGRPAKGLNVKWRVVDGWSSTQEINGQ
ncbi:cytochrome P450 [Seiridium cupressi]